MSDSKPKEYCGLCGISGGSEEILDRVHSGLHSLQHRGQEAAGIMVQIGNEYQLHKGNGLVEKVFSKLPDDWFDAKIDKAISHNRYSTAGRSHAGNAQPLMVTIGGETVGIAHNGTICNAPSLRKELHDAGVIFQTTTDTEIILHLMARAMQESGNNLQEALKVALRKLEGAFCLLLLMEDSMIAVRDPNGFRPLSLGDFDDGSYIVASETIAFSVSEARYIRDIEPGEMLVIGPHNKLESIQYTAPKKRAHCIFEHVYFARPGSYVFEDSVYQVRKEMGRQLAREAPVDADVIIPVPDSGMYAALGFAEESGIPLDMGLSRNHYVGRTFIDPGHTCRKKLVSSKLQPIEEALRGKKICLIEDSVVRGSTSRARIHTLQNVGVKEVHMRVSCPPHKFGCYFGIDFPDRDQLLANNVPKSELARALRLDSLEYLSRDGMLSCVNAHKPEDYCCACFDGKYPIKPDVFFTKE